MYYYMYSNETALPWHFRKLQISKLVRSTAVRIKGNSILAQFWRILPESYATTHATSHILISIWISSFKTEVFLTIFSEYWAIERIDDWKSRKCLKVAQDITTTSNSSRRKERRKQEDTSSKFDLLYMRQSTHEVIEHALSSIEWCGWCGRSVGARVATATCGFDVIRTSSSSLLAPTLFVRSDRILLVHQERDTFAPVQLLVKAMIGLLLK